MHFWWLSPNWLSPSIISHKSPRNHPKWWNPNGFLGISCCSLFPSLALMSWLDPSGSPGAAWSLSWSCSKTYGFSKVKQPTNVPNMCQTSSIIIIQRDSGLPYFFSRSLIQSLRNPWIHHAFPIRTVNQSQVTERELRAADDRHGFWTTCLAYSWAADLRIQGWIQLSPNSTRASRWFFVVLWD